MRHGTQVMAQMPLRHVTPAALCVPPGLVEGVSAHINPTTPFIIDLIGTAL